MIEHVPNMKVLLPCPPITRTRRWLSVSTAPDLLRQKPCPDHAPADGEHAVALAVAAWERAGTDLGGRNLDRHLCEIADRGALRLLRDRGGDLPSSAAHGELLTVTAVLRQVLGYSPTPTAMEVAAWALALKQAAAQSLEGPVREFPICFADGPYRGLVIPYPGHSTGRGPVMSCLVPVKWYDGPVLRHGEAWYTRADDAGADGVWPYRLAEKAPGGAVPHITVPDTKRGDR
ncbi:hypothetical protein ABZ606_10690 [Streptomyces sp. NPDC012461]|uniref:hypothetical protein n=1 Tax=unclassified Streptomyces TaxID=2593676 RepID=UPI00340DD301